MSLIRYDKKDTRPRKEGERDPKPHPRTEKPPKKNTWSEISSVS